MGCCWLVMLASSRSRTLSLCLLICLLFRRLLGEAFLNSRDDSGFRLQEVAGRTAVLRGALMTRPAKREGRDGRLLSCVIKKPEKFTTSLTVTLK